MENILVTVRFKPFVQTKREEIEKGSKVIENWRIINNPRNIVMNQRTKQSFTYDYVFNETSSNSEIFETIALPLVKSALEGMNCTIFAYGQTSSGKTFTIQGTPMDPGLISQSLDYIFTFLKENQRKCRTKISYLEVYNEQVNDLLDTSKTNLEIRERQDKGIYVEKLSECEVESKEEAFELLAIGDSNRKTGETYMNQYSSRSHSVFKINLEIDFLVSTLYSQINFVDLAGSEGVQKTKCEDLRLREGSNINKSLLSLSSVIQQLSKAKAGKNFVNFRDSKMTRLLQPALTGNSKTAVICTVNPDPSHYQETMNTLLFGSKAKTIKTEVSINTILLNEELVKNIGEENRKIIERNMEIETNLILMTENYEKILKEKSVNELEFENCLRDIREEKNELFEKLFKLTEQIKGKEMENIECENIILGLEQRTEAMSRELEKNWERKKMDDANIEFLKEELAEKNEMIYAIKKDFKDRAAEIERLEQEVRLLTKDKNKLQEKRQIVDILNGKINANESTIALQAEEIKLLQLIIAQNNNDFEKAQEDLKIATMKLEENAKKSNDNKGIQHEIYKTMEDLKSRNSLLENSIQSLERKIEENNTEKVTTTKLLRDKEYIIKNYQRLFEELNLKIADTEEQNFKSDSEASRLLQENKNLLIEITSFESCTAQMEEKLKKLENLNSKIKSEKDQLVQENQKILKEKVQILEENSKFQVEKAEFNKEKSELQEDLDYQIHQKLYLEHDLSDLKYELNRYELMFSNNLPEKGDFSEASKDFLTMVEGLKGEILEISQENIKLKKDLHESQEKIEKCEEELKHSNRSHQHKRLAFSLLDENMIKSLNESERYKMNTEILELQCKIQSLTEDLTTAKKQNQEFKIECIKASDSLEALILENLKIQEELKKARECIVHYQNDIGYLQAEREDDLYLPNIEKNQQKSLKPRKTQRSLNITGTPNCKTQ